MLDGSAKVTGSFNSDRVTMHVETLSHHRGCPLSCITQIGDRQASFKIFLLFVAEIEIGINQVSKFAVHVIGKHPKHDPNLRSSEPTTWRGDHGLGQVAHQNPQFLIEIDNRESRSAQNRVTEEADRLNGHIFSLLGLKCLIYALAGRCSGKHPEIRSGSSDQCAPRRSRMPYGPNAPLEPA
ncbi:unannotated protein [freshwater metagenome]|uniref:Unannotated protein n=1 Tax=freshwater metagenome TaxID=449393 RepID=A0A6J7ED03_9ZZZZ